MLGLRRITMGALAILSIAACDSETKVGLDGACASDDECEAGLVCDDAHSPKTCQEPHDHPSLGGGGAGSSAGGSSNDGAGGGGGAPPSLCEAHCACMAATCAEFAGYPFANEASCLTACGEYSTLELSCFGAFCEQASSGTATAHQCEHAWGADGTTECQ